MSTFRRMLTLLGVLFASGLAAMAAMTLRRAGVFGLYWPWAWFAWAKAYGHVHPLDYLADLALGLCIFVLPVSLTVLVLKLTGPTPKLRKFGADAWAKESDLSNAKLIPPRGDFSGRVFGRYGGILGGRFGSKMLVYKGNEPAIVVGATRSGKGAGHVVPTLAAWGESAFIYDRKGELWEITVDRRKTFSHCIKFDPTDTNTVRWNPLFEVRKGRMEIADIQNVVGILVDPLGMKAGDLSFWDQSAADAFTAIILHVLYTAEDDKKHLAEVRRMLTNLEPTLHAMLNTKHRYKPDNFAEDGLARDENGELIPETHPEIMLGAQAFALMDDRVKSNVIATMRASVQLWADPLVEYATSTSDFVIGDLVCSEHPVSFYLQTPQAHADRLAFLVRVFTRQTINSQMETLDRDGRGRRKRHRMLMLLDEFPKLGALPFLENAAGEMTGYGITLNLICQSFNDVFAKYGERTALFDNMHITLCTATSEPASIRKIIERAGKSRELRESYSDPRGLKFGGHRSTNKSEQQQYILSEEDVRGLDSGKQFLFVNNCKPIVAAKVRYWEEPILAPHCGDFFNGEVAKYQQKAGRFDVPGKPQIDWLGVRAIEAAPLLSETRQSARSQADRSTRAAADASAAAAPGAGLPSSPHEASTGFSALPSDVETLFAAEDAED